MHPHPSRRGARRATVWTVGARMGAVRALGRRLRQYGIEIVTLDSTSDYCGPGSSCWRRAGWRSSWSAHPRPGTCLAGPKTDKLDAMWLARLTEMGLLRALVRAA